MADIEKIVRTVFEIPDLYQMPKGEKDKLYSYVIEATCAQEARLFRMLDCSAYCVEEQCFFCGNFSQQYQ